MEGAFYCDATGTCRTAWGGAPLPATAECDWSAAMMDGRGLRRGMVWISLMSKVHTAHTNSDKGTFPQGRDRFLLNSDVNFCHFRVTPVI